MELSRHFAAVTEEERALLAGEPLRMERYTADASSTIKGSRLIPREQMITLRPHTRFAAFPPHSHDYVEAMYMLNGQTVHTLSNGETITLREGELLFINRHATHSIALCGAEDIAVNFIVQPEFFDFALETVGADNALGRFLLDALRNGESGVPYLYFALSDVLSVQCLLQSMIYDFLESPSGRRRIRRLEMGLLFSHLMLCSDRMHISNALRTWNELAVELLDEVQTRYASFSLAAFARRKRLSASYVSRVAREATGLSCTELLQRRRLEKAKQLLRDTDESVLSVCEQVGYSNTSYFYRLFESGIGMSPTEYRSSQRT